MRSPAASGGFFPTTKDLFFEIGIAYGGQKKYLQAMQAFQNAKEYSENEFKKVNNIALQAHKLLKCRGVTRSDFRFYKGKFYLLEINTQPGMTSLSLVPEIARYKNISFLNLIEWIIKDASINR